MIDGYGFQQDLLDAITRSNAQGMAPFADEVLSGKIDLTPARCLIVGAALFQVDSNPDMAAKGAELLAASFRAAGHLDAVAERVRQLFAWRDDVFVFESKRALFKAKLGDGADAAHERFDVLLDGSDRGKIFVIGLNKTGTTSIQFALQELGVLVAPQAPFERLFEDWRHRRFDRIVALCRHYEAFQDIPFCLPYLYQALDQAFPEARFILSVRNSAEEWHASLERFHRQALFGGQQATWELIEQCAYGYPGFILDEAKDFFRWQDHGLYDKKRCVDIYEAHSANAIEYFRYDEKKLLVLNVAEEDAYQRLCAFLGQAPVRAEFPKLNTSRND